MHRPAPELASSTCRHGVDRSRAGCLRLRWWTGARFGCGRNGHLTFAPDEPELAAQMRRHRCRTARPGSACAAALRSRRPPPCPGPAATGAGRPARQGDPQQAHPAAVRDRAIRPRLIVGSGRRLRLWQFRHSQISIEQRVRPRAAVVSDLFRQLGFNINHLQAGRPAPARADPEQPDATLRGCSGLPLYAVIELVEGVGLWLARRWGEYFAMIATSLGCRSRSMTSPGRSR